MDLPVENKKVSLLVVSHEKRSDAPPFWINGTLILWEADSGLIWVKDDTGKDHMVNFSYVVDVQFHDPIPTPEEQAKIAENALKKTEGPPDEPPKGVTA